MTEISNEIMNDDSNEEENSEPLLVGTNTTLNYDASIGSNLTYDTESQPLAVGTNLTIHITYAEALLLEEQLGINLDGSDDYLGSNITVINGNSDWIERIDNNPLGGEEMPLPTSDADDSYSWNWSEEKNTADDGDRQQELATEVNEWSDSSEPLLVGTNITFVIEEDTDGNSQTYTENESLSQRDEKTPFALGTNLLLELPDEGGQQANYLGTNLSTIGDNSDAMNSLEGGMIPTELANPTQSDNDDYAWNNGQLDRFTTDDSEGMDENIDPDALFTASPWGALEETGAVDGFEDVFPNGAGAIENNSFAGGGGGEI